MSLYLQNFACSDLVGLRLFQDLSPEREAGPPPDPYPPEARLHWGIGCRSAFYHSRALKSSYVFVHESTLVTNRSPNFKGHDLIVHHIALS